MLDIQFIRDNPDHIEEASKQKGYVANVNKLLEIDKLRRDKIKKLSQIQFEHNSLTESFKGKKPSELEQKKAKNYKQQVKQLELELKPISENWLKLLQKIPNIPLDDVPVGNTEADNKVLRKYKEPPQFDFKPKKHWELGIEKGFIDKERAAKVAGSRFAYLKGDLVLLEFALWQFALNQLTNELVIEQIIRDNGLQTSTKPFIPVLPPAVANTQVYEATGRLNKEEVTYKLADDDLWLNASAEHTLAPMYLGETLEENQLPIRYVGYTTAFRREAGTYGKDTEGIFRLHQFNKLEMESFTTPELSLQEHYLHIAIQEHLMRLLGLPYQVVLKCTAEMGFPNARGVDIEVWLPGQNRYRETHTADYLTDFQARKMQTRVRYADGYNKFLHTNDGTVFSERPLLAILENFQTADGHIIVPEVLRPFMSNKSQI